MPLADSLTRDRLEYNDSLVGSENENLFYQRRGVIFGRGSTGMRVGGATSPTYHSQSTELFWQRFALGFGRERQGYQADQEHGAHGHTCVSHSHSGLISVGLREDFACQQS